MQKNKPKKRSIFDDKRVALIFSLAMAALAWIIIAGFINPGEEVDIDAVPINYLRYDYLYKNQDLIIVSEMPDAADVTVSGNGSTLGTMTNTDVSVYPDYSSVNGPGTYTLPLKDEKVTVGSYNITAVTPKTITLQFENMATKTLPVTAVADGVTAQSGFFKANPEAMPAQVEVTGPASELDRITQAVATVHEQEEREKTKLYAGVLITLLDSEGNEVSGELITVNPTNVEVSVPILEERVIPIVVNFAGAPSNFDTEWLRSLMTLSASEIRIAGEPELLNNLTEYNLGTIDISDIQPEGGTYEFDVTLPDRIRNQDGLRRVSVSFDTSTLATKTLEVDTIRVINVAGGLTVEPVADSMTVTVVGPADVLEALLPEHVVVEVDAYGISATQGGQQTIPARVLVPGSNRVYSAEALTVVCDVAVEQAQSETT